MTVNVKDVTWTEERFGIYHGSIGLFHIGHVEYTMIRDDPEPWKGVLSLSNQRKSYLTKEDAKAGVERRLLSVILSLIIES